MEPLSAAGGRSSSSNGGGYNGSNNSGGASAQASPYQNGSGPIDLLGGDDGTAAGNGASRQPTYGQTNGGNDEGDDDGGGSDGNDGDNSNEHTIPTGNLNGPMSFKRRQKQTSFLPQSARSLLSTFGMARMTATTTPASSASLYAHDMGGPIGFGGAADDHEFETQGVVGGGVGSGGPSNINVNFSSNGNGNGKAGAGIPHVVDWYSEGLGRRVGYEDLTAIDWIFEYNKERQRQRALIGVGTSGLLGYIRRLLDAGQVWVVLVLTGLAAGALAAAIDVASDWLADLKTGYCASGGTDGGAFYLNHGFCCMGYDEGAKCDGWRPWAAALGIASSHGAGKWFLEYLFFIVLSMTSAICAALLVKEYAIYAKHSGIPEIKTMLGGFVIRRFLSGWTLLTKSLGLCLAVASGMWLGKEGPFVHVACCCANLFIKLFPSINNNEGSSHFRAILSLLSSCVEN